MALVFSYASIFTVLLLLSTTPTTTPTPNSVYGCYKTIVSFGDSLADTGNILVPRAQKIPPCSANPPNGRTFFHHPTGRCSDGRLIIDFIALSLGLPLVKPYLTEENGKANHQRFSRGVNFAVVGATALESEFYKKLGYNNTATNVSLGTQLDWFRRFFAGIADGGKYLESSLVVMGEIGGNDYNYPLEQRKTLDEVRSLVPAVVSTIGSTIQELIKLGAVTMLVPGNMPIGCLPVYLSLYGKASTENDYDPRTGCLHWLNEFSKYHNELLLKELQRIRELHPHVNIMYADYYNAALQLYLFPDQFGFGSRILRACWGGGGLYNYNKSAGCTPQTCCDDPASYASWDGVHFTETAYRFIAQGLLQGPYTSPHITASCAMSISKPGRYHEY